MTAGPESECLRRATRYSARGIEAAWPRRCAARFTRARCGDSRTRKDEKQQQRELGKCGYPHERFFAGDRSGSDHRKRFFSSPPTQAPLPGGKFGLRTTTSVFRRGVWTPIGAGVTVPTSIKSRL